MLEECSNKLEECSIIL
jgi:hypothetical protein